MKQLMIEVSDEVAEFLNEIKEATKRPVTVEKIVSSMLLHQFTFHRDDYLEPKS